MNEEKNIPWTILFGIAGFLDLISLGISLITLIPIIGWILGPIANISVTIIAGFSFWIYFLWKGHNFWKGALGSTIIESIPFINMLPAWTAYVAGAYLNIKGLQLPAVQKLGFAAKIASKII
ncbi:hypothetical protein A2833_01745 [Candidatus Azambacteria bacterium RIFCSPHIGHO2_01_FULL_44_55]|uniref:Uncharacterized protein n=1 Tax=Candidatus Azambacteria bacterium RIFCSPLOWO2_02_FULL_44_14 TaxID=1797306 RepID=A0A1F5CB23_9BACT|nr:MAG: hypothetical protein A3A18_01505 [Candidatus Azambacteria bacterium RIFCSPLOWO2_01_FULL_44_84]OGD33018.1 MAG: hypothetical protein A3C78_01400 [Candidatus Azambacteria bacterium RIFCSPHIGHO2_02_FULL_45_18]OGD39812.1 MAG: hypothetical protein A2833_01745 [Candidatus Azambacteria bacterium RIFCSPHIGHO2_01_FULL_44_55]OGD40064.1 MAG: hypothetical protein A3I30_02455 [Candidatus Azambacteria bacterium RIFCSPLOWO2_02_FULL_44_14]OGD52160.1 MAG: hypothetical protein A2608_00800 [Candidatus Azam